LEVLPDAVQQSAHRDFVFEEEDETLLWSAGDTKFAVGLLTEGG
jgi:hypothetical protein